MKLIRDTEITAALLTDSNILESGYSLYNAGTTYSTIGQRVGRESGTVVTIFENLQTGNIGHTPESSPSWWKEVGRTYKAYAGGTTYGDGDIVIDTATHRLFESLQASNTGHALTDVAWWRDAGPTNRTAPFDDRVGTVATWVGEIVYELTPGAIDALAVLDTNAETVQVVMEASSVAVYNQTKSLNIGGQAIIDWFLYFFEPVGTRSKVYFDDLPIYASGVVTVTITGRDPDGYVTAGTIEVGRMKDLGSTEAGVKVSIKDFSTKEQNDFGHWIVVERGFSTRVTARSLFPTENADSVFEALAEVRAKPSVFIIGGEFDSMILFGFYTDMAIDAANAMGSVSYLDLTVESISTSN